MKNIKILIILILSVFLLSGCNNKTIKGEKVYVYNWGEYIDESVLKSFEEDTGIKVIYEQFTQNEDMYMKIKEGGSTYDLIFPSDYMVERLIEEDMIQPINMANIPNIKNIGKEYLNMEYDPEQKYSIPYFWGTVGILYNEKLVDDKVDSWEILWNKKYAHKIIMMDSTRDSIGIALIKNGFSMNSRNLKELEIAKKDLIKQKPIVRAYLVDEMKGQMVNNEAALAPAYSGDAMDAMSENPDLKYVVPKEGTNLWFDAMAIPKNAKNVKNAEKFINYILEPKNAAKIAEYIGYSSPNTEAVKLLDEEIQNSQVAYPDLSTLGKLEIFKNPRDINSVYSEIWAEVKAADF
ncbi:spermidine/putrescine ABC transporter substrate-binding protein [Miniphocaeibacter halophilus]|uniref:Spermidine/putrescine ABC transporter substrate-binding protein n=1 Tax=Miniphocaeibacter halophilus TaxID=2931922 RepID=A0AC61MPK0_9FIRM|nr:spermidine/putrescine ABC transporter substrate-binding protein [Miniphocaeibacter halophilus]